MTERKGEGHGLVPWFFTLDALQNILISYHRELPRDKPVAYRHLLFNSL